MTKLLDAPHTESLHGIVSIRVVRTANGGWNVIAALDEHVLATRHYDDWHRAERGYQRMKADHASSIPNFSMR